MPVSFAIQRLASLVIRVMMNMQLAKLKCWTVIDCFRASVKKYPSNVMLVNGANGTEWTYTKVNIHNYHIEYASTLEFYLMYQWCMIINLIQIVLILKVEEHSNRVANYFHSLGYKKGDAVAFFMENRPEHIATWLGLAKIGVTPALINCNLRQRSLVHAIQVSNCRAIIYGIELAGGKFWFEDDIPITIFYAYYNQLPTHMKRCCLQ